MEKISISKQLKFCILAFLILFIFRSFAQNEIKFINKEKIKAENNLKGIKRGDTWLIKPQYNDISGYEDFILCIKEGITDIYSKDFVFTRIAGGVRSEHLNFYKKFLSDIKKSNKYCSPYFKNGKWGFSYDGENTGAKFDSLFLLCMENSTDNYGKVNCGGIMGVYMNGKCGVADAKGNLIVKPQDYTNIRFYYNDKQGIEFSNRFEIICSYKNNDTAKFMWLKDNQFVETQNKEGLKGYVYEGDIVEAKYTAVKYIYLPGIADYECVLPNGAIEYRKGTVIVPAEKIVEYKEKNAKEEQLKNEEELKKQKAKELSAKTGLTVEIKTKTHTLNVYPGWAGIFKNTETQSWLLSSDNVEKKPSVIFNEAPAGWLKDSRYVNRLNIIFEETENYTLEKRKQSFMDLAMRRSNLPKEKIKPVEEQFILYDGRKAMVLFYVCNDAAGMVGGNYVDCLLSFVSEKSPTTITSYTFFIDGGADDLPQQEAVAWKDYFKKVLLSIRPN